MPDNDLSIQRLFSLEGKVALVTGGSRGIGYMISQGLLQAGVRVYITSRKADACRQAAAALEQYGECIAIPADVTSPEGLRKLCEQLQKLEPRLHILINNAGAAWGEAYETYPESAFDKLMSVNVTAVFSLTRALTPLLEATASIEDEPARVVNIGSMDGLHIPTVSGLGTYAYTASKAAVHHLTRHLAVELGPRNITVNAIAPGFFPSKMTDKVFEDRLTEIEHNSLLGRVGKDEEMAGIAIYLCSRAGAYTHGAVIPVDGGTSINWRHAVVSND
jgi:NAD(P)-dependent dehydrogenase (short-subunit alcohol dehydrogenase family)